MEILNYEELPNPKKEEKPKATLVKNNRRYKMIIPANVEQKIRFACAAVPNLEWSGVLFYTYTGTFEKCDLTITCKDILVMDVGNATYTEWCADAEVISYMAENDLLDCQMGILHSHASMRAFFSGTDTATLLAEGQDRNNVISLIVNNKGEYEAAITRLVVTTATVTETGTYQFFGEGEKQYDDEYETEDIYVEYFMFDIIKKSPKGLPDFIDRMSEVMKKKKPVTQTAYGNWPTSSWQQPRPAADFSTTPSTVVTTAKPAQTQVNNAAKLKVATPGTVPMPAKTEEVKDKGTLTVFPPTTPTGKVNYSPTAMINTPADIFIETLALQLVTGNITESYNSTTILDEYVKKEMYKKFFDRFGYDTSNTSSFMSWLDSTLDFLVCSAQSESYNIFDFGRDAEGIALALHDRLKRLPSKNIYLTAIINRLVIYYNE